MTIADRTVSVQLRADVTRYIAAMRAASAANRGFGDSAEDAGRRSNEGFQQGQRSAQRLERALARLVRQQAEQTRQEREGADETRRHTEETERQSESQQRLGRSTDQANKRLASNGSALASLTAGAIGAGAAVTSAAVAVTAFGAVAAPSIIKVVSAQQDLGKSWDTLTGRQKTSALLVRGLADNYKNLAKSYEPQALSAFNALIGTSSVLLPRLGDLVEATGGDVQKFLGRIGEFTEGRIGGEFLTWAGQKAPEALDVLGTTAVTTGDTALDLLQDIEPLGISLLQLTNGALSVVNSVANVNPLLAQMAISAVLLRTPIAAVVAGVGNMTTRMRSYAAATRGATLAQRGMMLASAAGPGLWLTAGLALGLLAMQVKSNQTETSKLIAVWQAQNGAIKNSVAGYQQLRGQVQDRLRQEQALLEATKRRGDSDRDTVIEQGRRYFQIKGLVQADKELAAQEANLNRGLKQTAIQFGISTEQAQQLANAAGVDLANAFDKSGNMTAAATTKLITMKQAIDNAKNPAFVLGDAYRILASSMSSAEQRAGAYKRQLDLLITPSSNLWGATLAVKQGFVDLASSVKGGEASMRGSNAASLQLQQAFRNQIGTVAALFAATKEQTGSVERARVAVMAQIPQLYRLAGGNAQARAQVDYLIRTFVNVTGQSDITRKAFIANAVQMGHNRATAERFWKELQKIPGVADSAGVSVAKMATKMTREIQAIPDEGVRVSVFANGKWAMGAREAVDKFTGAAGGPVPLTSGAKAGRDSVPALLMPEEHIWTTREVSAAGGHGAMFRLRAAALRGELQGFAGGGAVRISTRVPGSGEIARSVRPVGTLGDLYMRKWVSVAAAAWKKYAGSGGAALGWARGQAGKPYGWGGVGPGSYDCSGWTSAITNVLQGRSPYSRRHTTHSFGIFSGPDGFVRSAPSRFMVGVTDAGVGHMAGTLGGVAVESSGSYGVRVGGGARGHDNPMFTRRYGLTRFAGGGPVTVADRALRPSASRDDVALAASLGLVGDPSSAISPANPAIPGYAGGGWVSGAPGRDRLLLRATAGEYLVNRPQAARHGRQLEAINAGRSGAGGVTVNLTLNNHGAIGSQIELDNWLTGSLDRLNRQQRAPWNGRA